MRLCTLRIFYTPKQASTFQLCCLLILLWYEYLFEGLICRKNKTGYQHNITLAFVKHLDDDCRSKNKIRNICSVAKLMIIHVSAGKAGQMRVRAQVNPCPKMSEPAPAKIASSGVEWEDWKVAWEVYVRECERETDGDGWMDGKTVKE